jgi:hypothetical protein
MSEYAIIGRKNQNKIRIINPIVSYKIRSSKKRKVEKC